jgi:hypothetical protein
MFHHLLTDTPTDEPIASTVGIAYEVMNICGVPQEVSKKVLEHLVYSTQQDRIRNIEAWRITRDAIKEKNRV